MTFLRDSTLWSCDWMHQSQNTTEYKKKKVYLKILKQKMLKLSFVGPLQRSLVAQNEKHFDS